MPDPEPSDAILTVRCQLGDPDAWELLVRRWHPKLWHFVSCMVSDQSTTDDIVQTIWLRVVRSLMRVKQPESLAAWLFRIARIAVADQLRDRYRHPVADAEIEVADSDEPNAWLDAVDAIHSGLVHLHPYDRETLVLHYLEGLPVSEVAMVCGVPEGTVKSRLSRARRILRQQIPD